MHSWSKDHLPNLPGRHLGPHQSVLVPTALRDQLIYLSRTQKPNNLNIPEWLTWIAAINTLLPHIAIHTNERNNNKLVSKTIVPNLLYNLRNSFNILIYRTNNTMAQVTHNLILLSNCKQHREPRGNNRGGNNNNNNNNSQRTNNKNNGNGGGKQFKNECGVYGGHK